MPNRQLSQDELTALFAPLIEDMRGRMKALAAGDDELYWALRRKLYKELSYDERTKPMQRKMLKRNKIIEQGGKCAICGDALPDSGAMLDRFEAMKGYVHNNVRVLCQRCDTKEQERKGYA